jgi:hypothetical protein
VGELLLVAAVQVGDIEIVEMGGIVDAVGEAIGALVHVDQMHRPIAGGDRRCLAAGEIDAEQLAGTFVAGLEVERLAIRRPAESAWNQIDAVGRQP